MIDPASPAFTVLFLAGAFVAGSIPFGLLVGRMFYKTDIRAGGSGNIGAANALRSLGAKGGAAVLLLDALKGFVPVALAATVPSFGPAALAAVALAAVLGHCFSPWLRFRGGKGVATLLGALFALWWPAGLVFMGVWLVVFRLSGYASGASIAGTFCSLAALYAGNRSAGYAVFGVLAALLVLWKHRTNIERLRAGTENKLTLSRKIAEPAQATPPSRLH